MGFFDYYKPIPRIKCPNCQSELNDWQGVNGVCGLFLWEQGIAFPIAQIADEEYCISEEQRKKFLLPEEFDIYTDCENCPDTWIVATGKTQDEVWKEIIEVRIEKKTELPRKWRT